MSDLPGSGPHRAGVLGSPIAHSLSPVLHRAAYDWLGLAGWTYEAYDVTTDALAGFLAERDETWRGLSLTMPLKAAVLPLLDDASDLVRAVGAANTVVLDGGRRTGENTDVPGMTAALHERAVAVGGPATVLGGGATARSTLAALAGLSGAGGAAGPVTVHLRDRGRGGPLLDTAAAVGLPVRLADWSAAAAGLEAALVVNTTPAGAADPLVSAVPSRPGVLFEVVYDPWPTPLAAAWLGRGGVVLSGLDLLVHQAVLQVGLLTRIPIDAAGLLPLLRAAGERALPGR